MTRTVTVAAPAKVNLHLAVGPTRPDGYHALDSVFHALELADELRVTEAEELTLACTPEVGVPAERNLAVRAVRAFAELVGREPRVRLELRKSLPHAAGLGGGSSDAAAAIVGLARLWDIDPADPRCHAAAAAVGADVPFFLVGGAALMAGRGDELARRLPALDSPVLLVRPDAVVSTAEAYRAFDLDPRAAASPDGVIAALETGDAVALGTALVNNLEAAAISLAPEVGEAREWLASRPGVLGVAVAGSGSAVFGVVDSERMAQDGAEEARARGWWSSATFLSGAGARVLEVEGGA